MFIICEGKNRRNTRRRKLISFYIAFGYAKATGLEVSA